MASDLVRLNIGGVTYDTTKTTLQNSKFFQVILNDENKYAKGLVDGRYFVDQLGQVFDHVLNLLRNPNYQCYNITLIPRNILRN